MSALLPARSSQPEPDIESGHAPTGKKGLIPSLTLKFGQEFANRIRRRLPRVGDKWHLDEVVIKIVGVRHWLWRAVDQTGMVIDVLVQSRRETATKGTTAGAI